MLLWERMVHLVLHEAYKKMFRLVFHNVVHDKLVYHSAKKKKARYC